MTSDRTTEMPIPPEAAMLEVIRQHGIEGARAVATFMFLMGSEATLTFDTGDDDGGSWVPCDFVMQHAWSLGATPQHGEISDA